MIEAIQGLGEGVLGFEAKGEVTAADYEQVLVPAVDAALEGNDKLSLLYVLGDEFSGYDAGAMWQDTKLGATHLTSWERIALVTDHETYGHMARAFGFLIPAHVRVFATAELDDAKAWVAGG